jgi:hypothetical protein
MRNCGGFSDFPPTALVFVSQVAEDDATHYCSRYMMVHRPGRSIPSLLLCESCGWNAAYRRGRTQSSLTVWSPTPHISCRMGSPILRARCTAPSSPSARRSARKLRLWATPTASHCSASFSSSPFFQSCSSERLPPPALVRTRGRRGTMAVGFVCIRSGRDSSHRFKSDGNRFSKSIRRLQFGQALESELTTAFEIDFAKCNPETAIPRKLGKVRLLGS